MLMIFTKKLMEEQFCIKKKPNFKENQKLLFEIFSTNQLLSFFLDLKNDLCFRET